jgi:nucleoporin NUP2
LEKVHNLTFFFRPLLIQYVIGVIRLKKHKTSEKRRIFMRNSATGKIVLVCVITSCQSMISSNALKNFGIYAGLSSTQTKNVIALMGHDAGVQVPYRIRVATPEAATSFNDALQREVNQVKAAE